VSGLLDLSIAEAHRRLVDGEISSTELTQATIAQIERTESHVRAYATVTAAEALEAARVADDELSCGEARGVLHGIPVAVKDLAFTRGIPTEAGSEAMKGFVPAYDATVVTRLREGGAILVGKTTTSEFAFGQTLAGTRNAWHQDYTASGSSAGSGVVVALRSAFAAIGTDTAGSIRGPAGANGVTGLKPTFGLVSKYGVVPMSPSLDHVGVLARTAADCADALSVVAGFDPLDPLSLEVEPPDLRVPDEPDLSGMRIGLERTHLVEPGVDPVALASAEAAAHALEQLGATVVDVAVPELDLAAAAVVTIKTVESSAYHRDRLKRDWARYGQNARLILEAGLLMPGTDYARAQQARTLVKRGLRDAFERDRLDALLGPAYGPPTLEGGSGAPFTYPMRSSAVNLAGMPSITIPCGFTDTGLPLGGFDLYGRPLGEATLVRVAHAYELAHPWHERTPPIADA
jgi:Asp-tRNA(Asn)/Glu-tRNA(Gln) amidotransferase A subunit family amidase